MPVTLGYSASQRRQMDSMQKRPTGISIIAGPTGSGKSTTLQCTLLEIHRACGGSKHLITVEDPPEYPMPGIVQTPVATLLAHVVYGAVLGAFYKIGN